MRGRRILGGEHDGAAPQDPAGRLIPRVRIRPQFYRPNIVLFALPAAVVILGRRNLGVSEPRRRREGNPLRLQRSVYRRTTVLAAACAGFVFGLPSSLRASELYWDRNGPLPGASSAPGEWNTTDANWNTSADGVGAPGVWLNDGTATAVFSAGADSTGNAVFIPSGVGIFVNGMRVEDGSPVISSSVGSTLTL